MSFVDKYKEFIAKQQNDLRHSTVNTIGEAINPKHKYVKASVDLMPEPDDTEQDMEDHIYKHGGDTLQVTKFKHNVKGTNGASEVHFNGEPHHVMKFINHHYDAKYPENMEGYKQYRKDHHGDEGHSVKESVEQIDEARPQLPSDRIPGAPGSKMPRGYTSKGGETPSQLKKDIKKLKNEEIEQVDEASRKLAISSHALANDPGMIALRARKIAVNPHALADDPDVHALKRSIEKKLKAERKPGQDSLTGGLRSGLSKDTTAAGKLKASTVKAMKAKAGNRNIGGPKYRLPEEVEQIDELKKSTLANYIGAASQDNSFKASDIGAINQIASTRGTTAAERKERDELSRKHSKRSRGIQLAAQKLAKENVEQIDEVLGKSASAGEWIKDFIKSKNPKFAGKSKEERRKQALAAYYAKKRED